MPPPGGYAGGYPGAPAQGWQPAAAYPPPWAYPRPVAPAVPDNGIAVAAFIVGISALGLLLTSMGLLFIVTLPMAVTAIFLGRSGIRRVDRGETPRHRGLGQAGLVMGIVGTVLSVLAAAAWVLIFVEADGWEDWSDPGSDEGLEDVGVAAVAVLTLRAARVLAG